MSHLWGPIHSILNDKWLVINFYASHGRQWQTNNLMEEFLVLVASHSESIWEELRLFMCSSRNNTEWIAIVAYTSFSVSQLFHKPLILHSELVNVIGLTSDYKCNSKMCWVKQLEDMLGPSLVSRWTNSGHQISFSIGREAVQHKSGVSISKTIPGI